jgi:flagellar hook-basal body complex protein FliE
MNPISSISSISSTIAAIPSAGAKSAPGTFQQVLQNTIGTIEGLNNDAGTAVQNFLTGKNEDLHTTVLATQQAEMAFQLGLQVRNKVVSAYQEIMKMQL